MPIGSLLPRVIGAVLLALSLSATAATDFPNRPIGSDWAKPYYTALAWNAAINESIAGFDWVGWRPEDRFDPNMQCLGMETWDRWPNLTATLLHRRLPERVVAKVIGGNFLRVFRDVCG